MDGIRIMEALAFFWQGFNSFLSKNFETIVATFVLLLAYRLLRLGLGKANSSANGMDWRRYAAFIAPGVGFALFGIIFIMGRGPLSLFLYLMTFTVIVGFGFAILGYCLFQKGVLADSDLEAVWRNKKLLLKRAAPGTLFALFGLAMISITLWKSPYILREHLKEDRLYREQLLKVIDERSKDALLLLDEYLTDKKNDKKDE